MEASICNLQSPASSMEQPRDAEALRAALGRVIVDRLVMALLEPTALNRLANTVLRFDAYFQNETPGYSTPDQPCAPPELLISESLDLSNMITSNPVRGTIVCHPIAESLQCQASEPLGGAATPARGLESGPESVGGQRPQEVSEIYTLPVTAQAQPQTDSVKSSQRKAISGLRPVQAPSIPDHGIDSHRQMQIGDSNFPKRAKTQHGDVTFSPEESSVKKFTASLWDQIHGGVSLDPASLLEQWRLTAASTTETIRTNGNALINSPRGGELVPYSMAYGADTIPSDGYGSAFHHSSIVCRKVTQASRTCRSIEVIVQARWIEHFDSYVESLANASIGLSRTRCRKTALLEACRDFEWTEKELRNKMAIWRGYKEIKDAAGWTSLVFAGMGLYRFCKYRIGFNTKGMEQLRALRPRIEVAADTLHPHWRQLLALIGEDTQRRFSGHPHDWVVPMDGSPPMPLRSTYLKYDANFSFEHIEESIVDVTKWGADDPRWIPPSSAAGTAANGETCRSCRQRQSNDARLNNCCCFPSLFGGPRAPCPAQVIRTTDGRNNGLQALVPFDRGVAVAEFVGLVTRGIEGLDVMDRSTGTWPYQIWQGRQGNLTRFINHSCKANAQFQNFVWLSTERIVLVSKGIEAGTEITVDYSESYWRGLDKRCLCGESCCRYRRT